MISLIVVLVLLGALLFVVQRLPLNETVKMVIYVVAAVGAFLYALEAFGVWHGLPN